MSEATKSLSDIIAASGSAFRDLVTEAYESGHEAGQAAGHKSGYEAGYRDAMSRVLAKIQEVASADSAGASETVAPDASDSGEAEGRATPGTVKPAIEKLVLESSGLTMQEIVERTGFKYNSVRGTLYTLKSEGIVDKWGEQWFPAKKEGPDVIESVPDEFRDLQEPKL